MVKRKKKTTVSASSCRANRQKLPDDLKAKFGSLGYVKWTCAYSPVLIVDPMQMVLDKSLPEGIYHAWLYQVYLHSSLGEDQHDEQSISSSSTANQDTLMETPIEMFPVLIYWFGTTYEFSIVRLSQVMDWDEGCKKGYNVLPKFMERRIQKLYRPVPAVYSLLEDALIKLNDRCLDLPPEERSLAVFPHRSKKKHPVVLNEWHALAMEAPPQQHSWLEQKELLEPELPHREWFGQIAFLPKTIGGQPYYHPVLIMNPFRVPPNLRREWFLKCSSGKLVMVYWLGAYTAGRMQNNVYTYHKLSDLVFYDEGMQRGYDKVDKKISKEYGSNSMGAKRLAAVDWYVCGVQWELPQALEREPKDRWGGLEDFEEDHDDDFEYYWECIMAAKEANKVKKNGSKKRKKQCAAGAAPNLITQKARQRIEEGKEEILDDSASSEIDDETEVTRKTKDALDSDSSTTRRCASPRLSGEAPSSSSSASSHPRLGNKKHKKRQENDHGIFDDATSDEEGNTTLRKKKAKRKNGQNKKGGTSPVEQLMDEIPADSMIEEASDDDKDSKQPAKAKPKNRPPSKRKKNQNTDSLGATSAFEPIANWFDVALREDEPDASIVATTISTMAPASPTGSEKVVEDAVENSLLGCAAVLQGEAGKTNERLSMKRKTTPDLSPPKGKAVASGRIQELKKRKRTTEQVVHETIEQWTSSKERATAGN